MTTLNEREAERLKKVDADAKLVFESVKTAPDYAPNLIRAKVLGGWLVTSRHSASSVAFVPDAKHEWLKPAPAPMRATKAVKKKRSKKPRA